MKFSKRLLTSITLRLSILANSKSIPEPLQQQQDGELNNFSVNKLNEPDPSQELIIHEIIEQLRQDNLIFDTTTNPSCIFQTLLSSKELELTDPNKRQIAIDLTSCVFLSHTEPKPYPEICINHNRDEDNVRTCINLLSSQSVWWITYFGYLNSIENFYYYYNVKIERNEISELYNGLKVNFENLLANLDKLNKNQVIVDFEISAFKESLMEYLSGEFKKELLDNQNELINEFKSKVDEKNQFVAFVKKIVMLFVCFSVFLMNFLLGFDNLLCLVGFSVGIYMNLYEWWT